MKGRRTVVVDGKRVRYSRYVMEQHLGRKLLPNELVHHINEDIKDDRIENLQLMTPEEHIRLHLAGKNNSRWAGGQKAADRRKYQKHRQKILEDRREYYQKNKEKISEYNRKYYQKNREKILEYQRKRYQKGR